MVLVRWCSLILIFKTERHSAGPENYFYFIGKSAITVRFVQGNFVEKVTEIFDDFLDCCYQSNASRIVRSNHRGQLS